MKTQQVFVPLKLKDLGDSRAAWFWRAGSKGLDCQVDDDLIVRIWDSVAQHWTVCHSLPDAVCERAREMATWPKFAVALDSDGSTFAVAGYDAAARAELFASIEEQGAQVVDSWIVRAPDAGAARLMGLDVAQ